MGRTLPAWLAQTAGTKIGRTYGHRTTGRQRAGRARHAASSDGQVPGTMRPSCAATGRRSRSIWMTPRGYASWMAVISPQTVPIRSGSSASIAANWARSPTVRPASFCPMLVPTTRHCATGGCICCANGWRIPPSLSGGRKVASRPTYRFSPRTNSRWRWCRRWCPVRHCAAAGSWPMR